MPITLSEPIVVPEKTFDKMWVKEIRVIAPAPGQEAMAIVTLVPFNSALEFHMAGVKVLNVKNIMQKSKVPNSNMEKAMFYLLAAIDEEHVEQGPPKKPQEG